ncbi:phosphopantetheine-binding protein [Allokutzneria sp. A3M-2-11 16]|uniref:acyl carrier protein n=1 Tax=Allokutzneria sp. A3M-2-11 16 TaxID=2962043 RepID=UPI0020B76EED|nr:phosphopantetheine-binding protein [Allokutzneria sp. A3M-2-11 16]MCP3799388.1 phosphopantetheine-binding protein [Allokutzneria sp. A3M-2-11 16]
MSALLASDVRQFLLTTINDEMNIPVDGANITDESPIGVGGLDLESIRLIELIARLQREYEIEIPDADIELLIPMTFSELVDYVLQRRAAA